MLPAGDRRGGGSVFLLVLGRAGFPDIGFHWKADLFYRAEMAYCGWLE